MANRTHRPGILNANWRGGKTENRCKQCGSVFVDYVRPGRRARVFCSLACCYDFTRRGRTALICEHCGKKFIKKTYDVNRCHVRFCSRKCASKTLSWFNSRRPDEHWNWKGGIAASNNLARSTSAFAEWRKAVYERDGYQCAVCGSDKPRIHAHHILEFAAYPERRFDVDNGLTLCVGHHQELHPNRVLADFKKYYIDAYASNRV